MVQRFFLAKLRHKPFAIQVEGFLRGSFEELVGLYQRTEVAVGGLATALGEAEWG